MYSFYSVVIERAMHLGTVQHLDMLVILRQLITATIAIWCCKIKSCFADNPFFICI